MPIIHFPQNDATFRVSETELVELRALRRQGFSHFAVIDLDFEKEADTNSLTAELPDHMEMTLVLTELHVISSEGGGKLFITGQFDGDDFVSLDHFSGHNGYYEVVIKKVQR